MVCCPNVQPLWASVSQSWEDSATFRSGFPLFCFERSAALAGPPWALPCFVSAAGPSTDAVLAADQQSPVEVSSFPRTAGSFSMNQKGVHGPTGRTAQLAAGFSLQGATEGRARLLSSPRQRLLWAGSYHWVSGASIPPGRQGRRIW